MHEIRLQHLSVHTQHHQKGELTRYGAIKFEFELLFLGIIRIEAYRRTFSSSQVNNRKYPKLKEVDDVLGGAAAWENVDSTAGNLNLN